MKIRGQRMKDESGYSMVEVLAAIVILSIAIIPMVGMFDAGLRAASTSGNFDKARAQANQELESIQALPYYKEGGDSDSAREFYPPENGPFSPPGGTTPCRTTLVPPPDWIDSCVVKTDFVIVDSDSNSIKKDSQARSMMQVEVTVNWGNNSSYTATGLISQGTA